MRLSKTATKPAAKTNNRGLTLSGTSQEKRRTRCFQDNGNRVEQALETAAHIVDALEKVAIPARDKQVTDTERKRGCEDEPLTSLPGDIRQNTNAGSHDGSEQEGGYATKH
jgi:hypothetical protein